VGAALQAAQSLWSLVSGLDVRAVRFSSEDAAQ